MATKRIPITTDVCMFSAQPNSTYEGLSWMRLGTVSSKVGWADWNGLLLFDISGIPANITTFTKADLSIYEDDLSGYDPVHFAVSAVSVGYVPAEVSWNTRGVIYGNWTAPGGDIDAASKSFISLDGTNEGFGSPQDVLTTVNAIRAGDIGFDPDTLSLHLAIKLHGVESWIYCYTQENGAGFAGYLDLEWDSEGAEHIGHSGMAMNKSAIGETDALMKTTNISF